MRTFERILCWITMMGVLLSGCAPTPLPEFAGPRDVFCFGWFIIIFLGFIGYLLFKKSEKNKHEPPEYLNETINSIDKRLRRLEKKVEEIGKSKKNTGVRTSS